MDITTILGLVLGAGFIVWSILLGGQLGWYFDAPSVVVVVGGMFSGFLVAFPLKEVLNLGKIFGKTMKNNEFDIDQIITKIIELANVARREGLLALEEAVSEIKDDFLQKGVMLIVDGTDPELVKNILETEIENISARHSKGKSMMDTFGSLGPAFGMIGTLIGLVAMLQNLSDPSSIGPAMAVALITTFYGAILANLIFIPMAGKLALKSNEELLIRNVMIEGLLSIQAGENPRIIEEKLKVFLPPSVRKKVGTQEAKSDNG
ncbi:MotA/TolQ/ExbB proton channel family protein [Fusibacter bizertensis]|uniref:MotA/TolQ/ExbB proton channel family protein n=1 Tax=Fusibacter bizertensis TaxID=1488331 RepID=A0ABT6N892_9FIRM|nr:MotA/TolQ/ExbB proton channel family protein [Fusibacter bizertensis]MDH8676624.1 MotA/TolQ/ExbB proton channel family protein [Fusibacter bizertensis]